jgi:hypothetical protein
LGIAWRSRFNQGQPDIRLFDIQLGKIYETCNPLIQIFFHFIPKGKSISRVLLSPTSTHPLSHTPKAGPEGFKMSPEKTFGAGLTTCGQNYRRKGGCILGIAINGPIRPCSFFLHLTPILPHRSSHLVSHRMRRW